MDSATLVDTVVRGIEAHGHAIVPGALPAALVAGLSAEAEALDVAGAFVEAHTGRDVQMRARHARPRGDRIAWLDAAPRGAAEATLVGLVDALRVGCNRALWLGLEEHELHYAIYPPGAGYVRHRDRFRDDDARVLSLVMYLNEAWHVDDGGALRLYLDTGPIEVAPHGGTLVAFLADSIEHEVLPARRERRSLTGWLRRRVATP